MLHKILLITPVCLCVFLVGSVQAAPLEPIALNFADASETSATLTVQAGSTGAPNGIWLEWMTRPDYDSFGWTGYAVYCSFVGVPTLNTEGTASSYLLGPGEMIEIELGDLFDETGVWANYSGELEDGVEYVARAYALGGSGFDPGPWTPDFTAPTLPSPPADCIHTQGYWKNHPGAWPITTITLGTVSYDQTELLSIFNTPAKGNGLIFLAHQLISTKLNLANGANAPASLHQAVADADALIGALVVPPVGSSYLSPGTASPLNDILDSFNNGTGGGNCEPVPTQETTWGEIKARFN